MQQRICPKCGTLVEATLAGSGRVLRFIMVWGIAMVLLMVLIVPIIIIYTPLSEDSHNILRVVGLVAYLFLVELVKTLFEKYKCPQCWYEGKGFKNKFFVW